MEERRPDDWIYAVIAVWHHGAETFYVRRSEGMANYPGVWSLLSIQFRPDELYDQFDLAAAQRVVDRMATERLCGVPVGVFRYLSSATCSENPMRRRVMLHMYEVGLAADPPLNGAFYTASAWLNSEEYRARSEGAACSLCIRMWSDWCVHNGLAERPFAPAIPPLRR